MFKRLIAIVLPLFLLATSTYAQDKQVAGKVTDSAGAPVVSASIVVKGARKGTQTSNDGSFSLSVPASATKLVVSSLNFQNQEVPIGNGVVNVTLKASALSLEAVTVVSVGYGTLNKREVTSAITHLSSKDLLSFGGNSPLTAIQGKVAGLSVVNTAQADPNSSPSLQLRGVSSRSAGLGPLYVINGIPGGNVDNLNPNDIESIDVLKGGAASAIYGTRGSNGVILITTKKGTSVSQAIYNSYAAFDMPVNRLKVLTRDEFVQRKRGVDFGGNTDWFKAVSRDYAFQHKQTLQFSGGNARNNYLVSFDYRNANGLDLRSSKEEYGARLNLNHTSANNLYSVGVTIAPRYFKSNNASYNAFNQTLTLNPTLRVEDSTNPNKYNFINTGFSGSYNPVEELNTVLSGTEGKYLDWNAFFKLNILRNLYTQFSLGQNTSDFFGFGFTPSYNTGAINGSNGRNSGGRNYDKRDQKTLEWIGNYSLDLGKHSFKLLGGYSYYYFNNSGMNASGQNFTSDVLTYNNIGTGTYNLPIQNGAVGDVTFRNVGSYKNDSKLIAFFGRVNYDFAKKYYMSASLRREGSSKFGYDNKWGYFPAASVGWRISNEEFFPKISWLSDLKLRADYGVTGNQDFGSYQSLDLYGPFGTYTFNGLSYRVWGPRQNTNFDLRWEKALNFNAGLDFEILRNRISGSVNYFVRSNKDLLGSYNVPIPPNVQGTTFLNVGTMKNSGFELQLNGEVIQNKNFSYNVSFAGASNDNKFVSFSNEAYFGQTFLNVVGLPAPGSPGTAQRLEEGRRIGSFFMLKSAGVDPTGRLLVYNKDGKIIPGNQASANDKQYVGNGLPKFTASLGNTITVKNFDLGVFFRSAFGYKIFNTVAFYTGTPVTQTGANVLASAYDNGGKYAALTNAATYSSLSDYFLEKGDFIKVDNVSLGYNFMSPIKNISSGRLYVTARNLYTFTNFTGGDPETISVNGLYPGINSSLSYYPPTLQLLVGVQLKF
ncbi:SusC/RagA family TonB-linked outer membrane protein [Segetibacter sp.]|jgi:TonB-linked SusC/RagA family outer membrane protein|uniref:SusC/RagA family TonB-linked outer membrane protein n=1 Tax=Segetibacter sp. TaxID=2231182 RepID=UPI00262ED31B|nr:SusC/RagA family TonB-linked outer membrane protein [Segetibacter sp.]MCW3079722.1 SusC/RagA family TonB-linked outer membrane protein [Segetibacter sp.]